MNKNAGTSAVLCSSGNGGNQIQSVGYFWREREKKPDPFIHRCFRASPFENNACVCVCVCLMSTIIQRAPERRFLFSVLPRSATLCVRVSFWPFFVQIYVMVMMWCYHVRWSLNSLQCTLSLSLWSVFSFRALTLNFIASLIASLMRFRYLVLLLLPMPKPSIPALLYGANLLAMANIIKYRTDMLTIHTNRMKKKRKIRNQNGTENIFSKQQR